MEVTTEMVQKIAHLARLHIPENELEITKADLQKMISFVDKLNELDTTDVQPLLHMTDNVNFIRKDKVQGSITTEEALKNAAVHDEQYFKVPKVIKK